jgi:hypothetical protein
VIEEGAVPDKLTVDLHPVFRDDRAVDRAVRTALFRAAGEKVPLVEIIREGAPGSCATGSWRCCGKRTSRSCTGG